MSIFFFRLIQFTICLFLTLMFFSCYPQTTEEALEYAQWSYSQKKYYETIESCERIIFFEKRKNILAKAYFQLANAHLAQNNFESALEFFSKIKSLCHPSDSVALEAEFGKTICHILRNDPHYAMISLIDLKSEMPEYFKRKKIFFTAVANFKINDFYASERGFIELLNNKDSVLVKEIFQRLSTEKNKINPRRAKIFSMILPGTGQLYIGDYKNALKSFLLNAAIIATGVHFATAYTILDAYLFTANWFFRYYKGGFIKAQINAENKINSILNASFTQLMELTGNSIQRY